MAGIIAGISQKQIFVHKTQDVIIKLSLYSLFTLFTHRQIDFACDDIWDSLNKISARSIQILFVEDFFFEWVTCGEWCVQFITFNKSQSDSQYFPIYSLFISSSTFTFSIYSKLPLFSQMLKSLCAIRLETLRQ